MLLISFLWIATKFAHGANYFEGSLTAGSTSCSPFEELRSCGPPCPITCDTLNTNVCCDIKCIRGCFCRDGYILVSSIGPRKCVTINNCPKPGILEFQTLDISVLESNKFVIINVLRINGSAGVVSVEWQTVPGSAKERTDFVPSAGVLEFPDGVTVRSITVAIVDDSVPEPNEDFSVVLSNPTNRAEISPRRLEGVRITIQDDDRKPGYIEVLNSSISVPENTGTVLVSLVRIGGVDGTIRIFYRTVDGTARAQTDYLPVNGFVNFLEGESSKTIQLSIVNDEIVEPIENFQLQLFDPSSEIINFRQLSTSLVTVINIIDDDMRPGYIEVELTMITVLENVGSLSISLIRNGGSDGQIRMRYRVVEGTAEVRADFEPIEGVVIFNDGETRKVISLKINDDDVREQEENFKLVLFDPSAAPGVVNFRSLGSRLETTIIIMDNDMKPGYIELPNPVITISESVGTIRMNIIRVGGQDGEIRIKYRTVDLTATAPSDYVSQSGELIFGDGVRLQQVPIEIVDDSIFEPTENFRLELFEPTAAKDVINFRALSSSRLSTVITIMDDDMKPGYIELEQVNATITEGYGTLQVTVVRVGGADGILRLKYKTKDLTTTAQSDYRPVTGDLVFENGETKKLIPIVILNDDVREKPEIFQLEIYDITPGTGTINFRKEGTKLSTLITILDDDMKPGYIELPNPVITISESVGTIRMNIIRVGGQDGEIRIKYRTVDLTASAPSDYVSQSGELIFGDGVRLQQVPIEIVDDSILEPTENFRLELFEPTAAKDVINFRALSSSRLSTVITIMDNDMKPGYIELPNPVIRISESVGTIRMNIIRVGGQDGEIRIKYRTVDVTATAPSDYVSQSGELIFGDGVRLQQVPIEIVDDSIFEPTENFRLELFEPTAAKDVINFRALSSSRLSTVITIMDDDMKPGFIELEQVNATITEGYGTFQVTVVRVGGADGILRLKYKTKDLTTTAQSDYRPVTGDLVFENGETKKFIPIVILNDDVKEKPEYFQLEIYDITPGTGTINFRKESTKLSTLITILDDDQTPGYVELDLTSINVPESVGIVSVNVIRSGGSDGVLRVPYRTVDISAVAGSDYKPQTGEVIFGDGETKKTISIEIINDQVREGIKIFRIQLMSLHPQLGQINLRTLGSRLTTTVSIIDDDEKPGIIEFEKSSISLQEDVGIIQIAVVRIGGTDGKLTINYKAVPGTAFASVDFELADGELVFPEGVDKLFISIRIVDDRIKERAETFSILIYEPEGVQTRRLGGITTISVTIIDNDNNPGVFEFHKLRMSVPESVGTIQISVVRKDGSDGEVSLQVRTRSVTATEGVDYRPPGSIITFPDGVLEQKLSIQILNDDIEENKEEFIIGIFNPSNGAVLGKITMLTVQIIDDDDPSVIRFRRRSSTFSSRDAVADIRVVRDGPLERQVSILWRIEDPSHTEGARYRGSLSNLLTFNPREREQSIRISLESDVEFDSDATFDIVLDSPSGGAVLGEPSRHTVEIILEDRRVNSQPSLPAIPLGCQVSFLIQTIRVREGDGEVIIPIGRSGQDIPFNVSIRTVDGSALGRRDYMPVRGPISFASGDIEIQIRIRIIDDDEYEPEESFTVVLFNPSLGTVSLGVNVVTVTIEDDDSDIGARPDSSVVTPERRALVKPPSAPSGPGLLPKCASHLILKTCSNVCPPTCSTMYRRAPCSFGGCIRGCFCPDGLVKESESNERCIRPSECPGGPPPREAFRPPSRPSRPGLLGFL